MLNFTRVRFMKHCRMMRKGRRSRGAALTELGAALAVGLPLVIAILFIGLECSQYFVIKSNLDVACRQAARQLAIAYGKDPSIAQNNSQDSNTTIANIYDGNKIPNFINDRHQFADPQFVGGTPGTVTVTVSYPIDGSYSLAIFPNPDPLNLASSVRPISIATFALE